MSDNSNDVELEQAKFQTRIKHLEILMEKSLPGYEQLLREIHRQLAADENLLHILKDEEIGVIISGLAQRKNIIIATTAQKAAAKKSSKAPKSLEDFM